MVNTELETEYERERKQYIQITIPETSLKTYMQEGWEVVESENRKPSNSVTIRRKIQRRL